MSTCKKHSKTPALIYSNCVGCELDRVRAEKKECIELLGYLVSYPTCECKPRSDEWHKIGYSCTCGHAKKIQKIMKYISEKNCL